MNKEKSIKKKRPLTDADILLDHHKYHISKVAYYI